MTSMDVCQDDNWVDEGKRVRENEYCFVGKYFQHMKEVGEVGWMINK
jgi:hypothetical protein